jgi:hypothetical protein
LRDRASHREDEHRAKEQDRFYHLN